MLRLVVKGGHGTWAPVNWLRKLGLFQKRPELLRSDTYTIKSAVSLEVLDVFLVRVSGNASPSVTKENYAYLKALSDEFGFEGFDFEFEAVSCKSELLTRREILGLKDRVDSLQRQILALRRQNEMWQREFEQRLRDVSQASQGGVERIERDLRDVDSRLPSFYEELQAVKRDISSLKEENGKLACEVPKSVDACERSVSRLRDEIALLKRCELDFKEVRPSSLKDENSKSKLDHCLDDISFLLRATVQQGVFSWLREREVKLGRKMVVVRQSSNDIYGWLDPDSNDEYRSTNIRGAWIDITFKAPVRVSGLKITGSKRGGNPKTFDVTFSDGPGSSATHKVSFVEAQELTETDPFVERNFDAVTAKLVRIESRGPSWDKSNVFRIGGFELFSPDEEHAGGIFRSIFARDRERVWDSFDVRARDNDGSELHIPNDKHVCTKPGEHQWVEIGFLHGRVVLSSYRIKKHKNRLRSWSLRASNNRNTQLEEWPVLHRHCEATEAEKTSEVLKFECASTTPFRFFRIVQEDKNWKGKLTLNFRYFDIDGIFIPD